MIHFLVVSFFFFFNDTATTEIYTLSLHDALPIWERCDHGILQLAADLVDPADVDVLDGIAPAVDGHGPDRKSTRLNSSHLVISYAVFCLKKKKTNNCLSTLLRYTRQS